MDEEKLTKSHTLVAPKYSKKIWRVIPKYRAYIRSNSNGLGRTILPTLGPELFWYSCCVCRTWVEGNEGQTFRPTDSGISIYSCLEDDDNYYIMPIWHISCREMFKLNPMAYQE